jgi:hypothetical protein
MGLRGRFGETATERQPEQVRTPERRKDLVSFDAKSLIHMVRLAGIEPTTPWFVANFIIFQQHPTRTNNLIKSTTYRTLIIQRNPA